MDYRVFFVIILVAFMIFLTWYVFDTNQEPKLTGYFPKKEYQTFKVRYQDNELELVTATLSKWRQMMKKIGYKDGMLTRSFAISEEDFDVPHLGILSNQICMADLYHFVSNVQQNDKKMRKWIHKLEEKRDNRVRDYYDDFEEMPNIYTRRRKISGSI